MLEHTAGPGGPAGPSLPLSPPPPCKNQISHLTGVIIDTSAPREDLDNDPVFLR